MVARFVAPIDLVRELFGRVSKLRELFHRLAIYVTGDVIVQILNFLLLPLYVVYLTRRTTASSPSRRGRSARQAVLPLGIDGAFMPTGTCGTMRAAVRRCESRSSSFCWGERDPAGRIRRVGPLRLRAAAPAPAYARAAASAAHTFAIGFTFIPFHVLRIQGRAARISAD